MLTKKVFAFKMRTYLLLISAIVLCFEFNTKCQTINSAILGNHCRGRGIIACVLTYWWHDNTFLHMLNI